jgi:tRNA/tmRNA/rRNA uracil-C5-methylase (TrmA/RlmC/RlmD family)
VAHGGFCVARHDGRVIFVRHALPGERVVAEVTEGGPTDRFLRADAIEVLSASPDRVEAPCPFAGPGRCGGCDWQHATPEAQRRLKAAVVEEQLRRLAKIERTVRVEEVLGADGIPPGLGWRTRVQFAVGPDGRAGLRRHRSHEIEPVSRCLIAHPRVEEVGVEGRRWPGISAVEVIAAHGSVDRLLIVTPVSRDTAIEMPELAGHTSLLRGDSRGGTSRIQGRTGVRERAAGRTWRVSGSGFWQVHPAAAQTLVDTVLAMLDPQPGETALDLYSGVGLFAGALAQRLGEKGRLIAVEAGRGSVEDARHNLRDLSTVRVEQGRVERVVDRLRLHHADLVVLDPPRAGAGRYVVESVSRLEARRIAYVACDPAALARDVAHFSDRSYRLADLRAFDLFPMTHHVECVALFEPVT